MRKIISSRLLGLLFVGLSSLQASGVETLDCARLLDFTKPVRISEDTFEPQSFGQLFFKLWSRGKLIHQTDDLLFQKGLLVDGGGLCGPTCVANATVTAEVMKGHAPLPPEQVVHDLVEAYDSRTKIDGRIGTVLPELLLASQKVHLQAHVRRVDLSRESLDLIGQQLNSGIRTLIIGDGRHAYLVLAVLGAPVRQLIISDPTYVMPTPFPYRESKNLNGTVIEFQKTLFLDRPVRQIHEAYLISWK